MNRRRGVAAGLLLLCLGLAGCSVGEEREPTPSATAKTTKTTTKAVSIAVRSVEGPAEQVLAYICAALLERPAAEVGAPVVQSDPLGAEGPHVAVVAQASLPNPDYDSIKLEERLAFVVRTGLVPPEPTMPPGTVPGQQFDIEAFKKKFPDATVLVPAEFPREANAALQGLRVQWSDVGSSPNLDPPEFNGAALVPVNDQRITDGLLTMLGEVSARVKYVLVSEDVSKGLNDWLKSQLLPLNLADVQDMAARKGNAQGYAQEAADWVNHRLGLAAAGPGPAPAAGFSLPQAALVLLAGGFIAVIALLLFGWRPAMARTGGGGRPGGQPWDLIPPGGTLPPTVNPPVHVVQAQQDERLVVGPEPKRIPMHLPWSTTSAEPGLAVDGGLLKGTTVRAASVRGRTHNFRGETRQDAYGVRLSKDEAWVIAAVADGLGSARHADVAAIAAVRAALEGTDAALRTARYPQNLDFKAVTGYVADAVRRATEALGAPHGGTNTERLPSARPGTTLTIAVVPADGAGPAVCAAVGDSPAMLISAERWRPLVGVEPKSGLAENVTVALPGDPDSVEVLTFPWRAGDLLLLSSDGFAAGVMGGQTRLAQLLTETWRIPPSLAEFARDVDFRLSTFDDDRTVVALWAGRHDTAVP